MTIYTIPTQKITSPLRTKSILFLTCLSLGFGSYEAEAKFPLNVFKGVTDSFQDDKKYMSPTLGIAALDSGSIGNIRFYGNFTPAYRTSSTGGQERDYANDHSKDPVWQMVRILFPSTAGQLSADSTHLYNFGKYVKNPMTVALLLKYADDVRSNKQVDEERLKNNLMDSLGLPFEEKIPKSRSIDLTYDSIESDRNLINDIIAESQQAIDDLEVYRRTNDIDQKILGQEKNKLLQKITSSVKKIQNESIKSIFMEKMQEIYKIGSYDIIKSASSSDNASSPITIPHSKAKKSPLDPDFFYRVKNELLMAKDNAEKIEGTLIKKVFEKSETKDSKESFIVSFKNNTLTPLLASIKRAIMDEQSGQDNFYPKYITEQIISAFFSYKFSTREDIQSLLKSIQALNPHLIDGNRWTRFNPNDLLTAAQLPELVQKEDYSLDDILALATADIWSMPTPYRVGAPILSNGNTKKYDRATDTFFSPPFADCVEISIRHLINCFLYDSLKRDFDFSGLTKYQASLGTIRPDQKNIFAAFKDFYAKQTVDLANEGSIDMRSQWNRVVGDLNTPNESPESAVRYRQQTNELDAGFINLMKVFHKIIGVKIDVIPSPDAPLDQKKKWLEKSFQTVFEVLNPNKGYSIALNMDYVKDNKNEISGAVTITVKNQRDEMLYSFDFTSNPDEHGQFENYQVSKDLKISDYSTELMSSNFDAIGAENVIWLLAKDAKLRRHKEEALPDFYILYTEGLSDNNAKIRFLENISSKSSFFIRSFTVDLLKILVKNVISDLNLEDSDTLLRAAPVLLKLSRDEGFKEMIKESMKTLKFGERYAFYSEVGKKEAIDILSMALKVNNPIRSLDLSLHYNMQGGMNLISRYIDSEEGMALAEGLKANNSLISLNLAFNNIGPKGTVALADALKVNTSLSSLNLNANNIGSEGALALADALKTNISLTSLSMSYIVTKQKKSVAPKDFSTLAEVLKTKNYLVSLDFSSNNLGIEGTKALADVLMVNPSLAVLKLNTNNMGDEGVRILADTLKNNTSLTDLSLTFNNFTSKGIVILSESLKNIPTLSSLDLVANDIGNEGAFALAENLKNNTSLHTLNLGNFDRFVNIADEGAMALGNLLEANPSITELQMGRWSSTNSIINRKTIDMLKARFGNRINF